LSCVYLLTGLRACPYYPDNRGRDSHN
jgi:hypothetical protein